MADEIADTEATNAKKIAAALRELRSSKWSNIFLLLRFDRASDPVPGSAASEGFKITPRFDELVLREGRIC
ncbi:MAG: hypothetical protein JO276_02200 [Sphingomonadaceae bacterium]|nr:hypothetical protein [Sphingomonas sp.]MBV9881801.1 hypothetical protein [Sphingomonadaceae bacterium]